MITRQQAYNNRLSEDQRIRNDARFFARKKHDDATYFTQARKRRQLIIESEDDRKNKYQYGDELANAIELHELDNRKYAPKIAVAKNLGHYLLETEAEWNYKVGVPVSIIHEYGKGLISDGGSLGVTLGWNYLDGIMGIANGIYLLQEADNHNQASQKVKGIVSIVSGIELFAFSYNPWLVGAMHLGSYGGAALASPAFAICMLCDLINATIDYGNTLKKMTYQGWKKDLGKQEKHLDKRIQKLENKIQHNINRDETNNYLFSKKYDKDKRKLELLYTKRKRCKHLQTYSEHDYRFKIKPAIRKEHDQKLGMFALKAASCIGMALVAIGSFGCPPAMAVCLGITAVVAATYLIKNTYKAGKLAHQHGVFGKIKNALTPRKKRGYEKLEYRYAV